MSRRELFGLLRGRAPVRASDVARPVIAPVWQVDDASAEDPAGDARPARDGRPARGAVSSAEPTSPDGWTLASFYAARARTP